MKDWFKHKTTARNDERIQALRMSHGVEGYGFYMYIVEMMHDNLEPFIKKDRLSIVLECTGTDASKCQALLSKCLELGLFTEDDVYLHCKRAEENIDERLEISKKRSESGRLGGNSKASAKQTEASAKQRRVEKSREEERRVEKSRTLVANATDSDREIANELLQQLINTNVSFNSKYTADDTIVKKKIGSWSEDIEKLRRIDKIPSDKISMMIQWLFTSKHKDALFWRGNIQSGKKLREHFPKLINAMEREYVGEKSKKPLFISSN